MNKWGVNYLKYYIAKNKKIIIKKNTQNTQVEIKKLIN